MKQLEFPKVKHTFNNSWKNQLNAHMMNPYMSAIWRMIRWGGEDTTYKLHMRWDLR